MAKNKPNLDKLGNLDPKGKRKPIPPPPKRKIQSIYKKGPLSSEEKKTIAQSVQSNTWSDEELSTKLRRPKERIQAYRLEYLTQNPQVSVKKSEHTQLRDDLHNHYQWGMFKKEYTDDEIILFEHDYVELMSQFKNDILPTEMKQIFQAIQLSIMIHRHGRSRFHTYQDIERLRKLIAWEYSQFPDVTLIPPSIKDKIYGLEQQVQILDASSQGKSKEMTDLQGRFSATLKELKSTREQRITKIESSNTNFVALLKQLEEEDFRDRLGNEMVIQNAAVEKEMQRLAEYHTYMDKSVDRPLLTPETVLLEDPEDKQEKKTGGRLETDPDAKDAINET